MIHRGLIFVPITSCITYLITVDESRQRGYLYFELAVLFNDSTREESGYSCNMFAKSLELSNIPANHLKYFVFIDDGFLGYSRNFPSQSSKVNTKKVNKILGKSLHNWRNSYSPLRIYTFENSIQEPKNFKVSEMEKFHTKESNVLREYYYDVIHDSSAPCSRIGPSFVISPEEDCGYLFGGFAELQADDSRDVDKSISIFFPLDDCWKLHLKSLKWEKIFDCSVPIPTVITSETKFPDYFMRCEAFYDQKTKLIVGYGERMKFQINGTSDARAVGTAFIIDPALKIRKIVGTLDTNFIRILPDVYVERVFDRVVMLCTPKLTPLRSFDIWSSDMNRLLKEELVRDVLEDKYSTWTQTLWRSAITTLGSESYPEIQTTEGHPVVRDWGWHCWTDMPSSKCFLQFFSRLP